jgi:hypothetical protein
MSELDKGQKANQRPIKYLWFGYGNYGGGHPNMQIGGGNIRDPSMFEELFKNAKTCFTFAVAVLVGLTLLVMLLAWVVTTNLR